MLASSSWAADRNLWGREVFREMYLSACLQPCNQSSAKEKRFGMIMAQRFINVPVLLELREDLSLGMIANNSGIDEAT